MRTISDKELGDIIVRQVARASHIRFKLSPKGQLIITAPTLTPLFVIKQAIRSSRRQLATMLNTHRQSHIYSDQQQIGKSHRLAIIESTLHDKPKISVKDRHIVLSVPPKTDIESAEIQNIIQSSVLKVVRKEAKAYLNRRLSHLASKHGFSYQAIRFTHTGSRWGSCSSQGTISLNIALMKLPLELIDYVLIHELCHTKQMNHSADFWKLVEQYTPDYRELRHRLKSETPSL